MTVKTIHCEHTLDGIIAQLIQVRDELKNGSATVSIELDVDGDLCEFELNECEMNIE